MYEMDLMDYKDDYIVIVHTDNSYHRLKYKHHETLLIGFTLQEALNQFKEQIDQEEKKGGYNGKVQSGNYHL